MNTMLVVLLFWSPLLQCVLGDFCMSIEEERYEGFWCPRATDPWGASNCCTNDLDPEPYCCVKAIERNQDQEGPSLDPMKRLLTSVAMVILSALVLVIIVYTMCKSKLKNSCKRSCCCSSSCLTDLACPNSQQTSEDTVTSQESCDPDAPPSYSDVIKEAEDGGRGSVIFSIHLPPYQDCLHEPPKYESVYDQRVGLSSGEHRQEVDDWIPEETELPSEVVIEPAGMI